MKKTLTIPHDTSPPKFGVKVGESFDLKFDKEGKVSHQDLDHFDPVLPKGKVGPSTPVSTHKAKKKGEVNITFTTIIQNTDSSSTHTILIGD
jgi:hypothetical protein